MEKKEQVIISKCSKKEACSFGGLCVKKHFRPLVVVFGSNKIYQGYGYTVEEAIKNSKLVQ